jgi:Fur family ferric uptake transcriptional regulator
MVKPKHSCKDDPDFVDLLRKASLKATKSRLSIIGFLFHKHGPFTPDEIFQNVGKEDVDLTTVYRTVTALEKIGILVRCEFGDGVARFEFPGNIDMSEHHHHVICRRCKKVTALELCLSDKWKKTLAQMGYTELSHTLEFFGVCQACETT